MKLRDTGLPEVKVLEPDVYEDERGFFMEAWNRETLGELGLDVAFVQGNHSRSARGVLRGLHYQLPHPQGKLVRCTRGEVFSAAVDLRRSSAGFTRWVGIRLSAENRLLLWVPPGFAHGFLALGEGTEVQYTCTVPYRREADRAVAWDDPELGVAWPVDEVGEVLLSPRDREAPGLEDAETYA